MPKRLLILCEAIDPPAYTPRVLTLATYLQNKGWEYIIATEQCMNLPSTISAKYHVLQMPPYEHLLKDKLFWGKDKALVEYIESHLDMTSFDLIFCSSYYYFPLYAASSLSRKYHKPLVIDLRDIAEQWGNIPYFTRKITKYQSINQIVGHLYAKRQIYKRNKILQQAVFVTSVSPWHVHFLSQYNRNTHLIYNGYDADTFIPSNIATDKFRICYLGKLYSIELRDPRPLFLGMKHLLAQKAISKEDVEIHFYTDSLGREQIDPLGKQYNIEDILHIHHYIAREEILPIMHTSSILLVLTTTSTADGTHGIMGTKFFENIGVEKPILSPVSDRGCLADAIEKTNAGLAATTTEEVEQFILEKYHEWQEKGFTRQPVKNKEQFTRQHEAQQFEELFLQCLQ